MRILTSRLLDAFPHGFTTRSGGVSPPPWDTLNLGGAVGDDPANVKENWGRLGHETGLGFARVRQVHGARALVAGGPTGPVDDADAVLSLAPGVAACVSIADCVPVLVAHPRTGAVAAVHAGWRGTLALAAESAVRALVREAGARPEELLAAIGPSIGPCCYEVSPDLAERFRAAFGDGAVRAGRAPHVDLWAANAAALRAAGIGGDRIEVLGRCTSCERDLFFSHRRDVGRTGRHVAFVAPLRLPAGAPLA